MRRLRGFSKAVEPGDRRRDDISINGNELPLGDQHSVTRYTSANEPLTNATRTLVWCHSYPPGTYEVWSTTNLAAAWSETSTNWTLYAVTTQTNLSFEVNEPCRFFRVRVCYGTNCWGFATTQPCQ
jgi:hypothetical protein